MNSAKLSIKKMINKAVKKIPNNWKSFAISTKIPKEMLIAEEESWDHKFGESIKSKYNKKIVEEIVKKTGLKYDIFKADGKIIFNIEKKEVYYVNSDLFIFGRYKKFRTDLAQSEWQCKKCKGKGGVECEFKGAVYKSIEGILSKAVEELYQVQKCKFHASGREDVDVVNSVGRAFVIELRNPKVGKINLEILKKKINQSKQGIEINDLGYVSSSEIALVSASHFDKWYAAELEIKINKNEARKIVNLKGCVLKQRTPLRVKHRRSDIIRKRKILDIKILNKTKPIIYIFAEAGTYIKEFIHGDNGRTQPNIAQTLGRDIKSIKLSVIKINDEFLRDIIG